MTSTTIKNAQECLTISYDDQRKKIIDIENLLHRHKTAIVVKFLDGLYHEYEALLKKEVSTDKSSSKIDETVSRMFRIFMAMREIEREDEEVMVA